MKKVHGCFGVEEEEEDVVILDDNHSSAKKSKIGKKRIGVLSSSSLKTKIGSSSTGSTSIDASLGKLSLKSGETLHDVVRARKNEKQPLIVESLKKEERLLVDQYVAKAFFSSGIPFNVRNNFDVQVYLIILNSEFKIKILIF